MVTSSKILDNKIKMNGCRNDDSNCQLSGDTFLIPDIAETGDGLVTALVTSANVLSMTSHPTNLSRSSQMYRVITNIRCSSIKVIHLQLAVLQTSCAIDAASQAIVSPVSN